MVIPCGTTTFTQLSRLNTDPADVLHPAPDVRLLPPAGVATGLVARRCPREDFHLLDNFNRFHRGSHPRIPTVTSLTRHDSALLGLEWWEEPISPSGLPPPGPATLVPSTPVGPPLLSCTGRSPRHEADGGTVLPMPWPGLGEGRDEPFRIGGLLEVTGQVPGIHDIPIDRDHPGQGVILHVAGTVPSRVHLTHA